MGLTDGKVQLLILAGFIALSITAENFRRLAPEDAHSRTRSERFQYLNCLDLSYGTAVCIGKGTLKHFLYSNYDFENNKAEALKTNTFSSFLANYNTGAIFALCWDLAETIYFGGTTLEGISRGAGALSAAFVCGIIGSQYMGSYLSEVEWSKKMGFMAGSLIGGWFGGRIGLMAYDIVHGLNNYFVNLLHKETKCVCHDLPSPEASKDDISKSVVSKDFHLPAASPAPIDDHHPQVKPSSKEDHHLPAAIPSCKCQ